MLKKLIVKIIRKYISYNFLIILSPSYNFISKNSQELTVLYILFIKNSKILKLNLMLMLN